MSSETSESVKNASDEMQRSLSLSLYWYVEKSMGDMLEGFMLLGKDEDDRNWVEMNQIINQMTDLPLDFDGPTRQLAVSLILSSILRHASSSTKAVIHLLGILLRRKSDFTGILKSDFLMLLEHVFFRDVKKEDYLKPEVTMNHAVRENSEVASSSLAAQRVEGVDDDEEEKLHPKVEARAYAEILVYLYRKEFVNATQVLVYLKELSMKQSSFYHTDLLLFLLTQIGSSVESRLNRVNGTGWRNGGNTPTSSYSSFSSNNRSTFDDIFKRLASLLPYVISPESRQAYDKVMRERKRIRSRSRSKRETSRESLGVTFRRSNLLRPSRFASIEIANVKNNEDEAVTPL